MAENLEGVEESTKEPFRLDRRDLLKKGAIGAAAVGVVWAAPEIIGLTTAPAYAQGTSGLSTTPCSGDITFDLAIPCPPSGHGSANETPSANCGVQGITVDSHWAIGQPHDTTADRPNAFNDVTPQDAAPWKHFHTGGSYDLSNDVPPYIVVGVHRNTGNTHCKFTAADFTGTEPVDAPSDYTNFFNPQTKQKFTGAFQTSDVVSVGWAADPNERADLGAPYCSNTDTKASLHLHCT
ncbi:MAG: twin-arginine translocation signal domain-containing protein [Acidimicrobiales bacterium]